MAATSIDLLWANLIKDYLDHADSITAGVPATTVLPRILGKDLTTDKQAVQAVITASLEATGKSGIITVLVNVIGQVKGDVTAEVLSQYQAAIGARLTDVTSFYLWLAAQPEASRTGYKIMRMIPPSIPDVTSKPEDKKLQFPVVLRVSLARYTLTAD